MRKQKRVFSRFQVDIKYLTDIPEYEIWRWEHHLPEYLITARDYKTGATYLSNIMRNHPLPLLSLLIICFFLYIIMVLIPKLLLSKLIMVKSSLTLSQKLTLFEKIVTEKYME